MRVALLPIVLTASLVLVACATVEKVGTSSYAPLSSTTDVALFTAESQVEQPFEVVANISYNDPGKFQILSLKDIFEPLKAKAREIGANGVIIDSSETVISGIVSRGIAVKARAIRLPMSSPAAVPQSSPKDAADALRELRRLRDEGVIDDRDYETKKAEILRRL
jgi:hypothetical protein